MNNFSDQNLNFPDETPCPGCGWPLYCCLCPDSDDEELQNKPEQAVGANHRMLYGDCVQVKLCAVIAVPGQIDANGNTITLDGLVKIASESNGCIFIDNGKLYAWVSND